MMEIFPSFGAELLLWKDVFESGLENLSEIDCPKPAVPSGRQSPAWRRYDNNKNTVELEILVL